MIGSTRTARPRRSGPSLLGLVLLLVAGLTGPAMAQADHKSFTAAVTPSAAAAGVADAFTASLVNTSTQQQLGSGNITRPAGWTIEAVGVPLVDGVPRGTAAMDRTGATIQLRNLSAPPGSEVTIAFTAVPPCDAGAYTFGVVAKQANNFQGPPGNDLNLDTAGSALTVTVTGGCGTKLNFFTQPTHAGVGEVISSAPGNPDGPPVQVEVLDENDERVTTSTAKITVALGHNPTGAELSGDTERQAVGGVATFDDLKIDTIGDDYTLVASAVGLTSATSNPFSVWEEVVPCDPNTDCTLTVERRNELRVTVRGRSSQQGVMFSSITPPEELDCGDDFYHAPYTTVLDSFNVDGAKTAELRIDRQVVLRVLDRGAAHWQVCFEGDAPFVDRDGVLVPAGGHGLLPDCGPPAQGPGAPCVESRFKAQRGDMVVTFRLPENDPKFR